MAFYTVMLYDMLCNYALPETNLTWQELIQKTRMDYFNFSFPWYDGSTVTTETDVDSVPGLADFMKVYFETYMMEEIGVESVQLHKMTVCKILDREMPVFKNLYDALSKAYDPVLNEQMEYTELETRMDQRGKEAQQGEESSSQGLNGETYSGTLNDQSITSDNPQVTFSDGDYASGMSRGQNQSETQTDRSFISTDTRLRKNQEVERSEGQAGRNRKETGIRGQSYYRALREYQQEMINLNTELVDRFKACWMLVRG